MSSWAIALDRAVPDYRILANGKLAIARADDCVRDRLFLGLSYQCQTSDMPGDWYLDVTEGLPHYGVDGILGGHMSDAEVTARIRRGILQDPEVRSLQSMDLIKSAYRAINVNAVVTLETGQSIKVEV